MSSLVLRLIGAAIIIAALVAMSQQAPPARHFYQAPCLNNDGYDMSPFDTVQHGAMCPRTWQDI